MVVPVDGGERGSGNDRKIAPGRVNVEWKTSGAREGRPGGGGGGIAICEDVVDFVVESVKEREKEEVGEDWFRWAMGAL